MDYSLLITLLSIAVSALMFCITYLYAQPLRQMISSIDECVKEIKASVNEMRNDASLLRSEVDRLKDHEKAIWRAIEELREAVKN